MMCASSRSCRRERFNRRAGAEQPFVAELARVDARWTSELLRVPLRESLSTSRNAEPFQLPGQAFHRQSNHVRQTSLDDAQIRIILFLNCISARTADPG